MEEIDAIAPNRLYGETRLHVTCILWSGIASAGFDGHFSVRSGDLEGDSDTDLFGQISGG